MGSLRLGEEEPKGEELREVGVLKNFFDNIKDAVKVKK